MTQLQLEAIVADEEEVLEEISKETVNDKRSEYAALLDNLRDEIYSCAKKFNTYSTQANNKARKDNEQRAKQIKNLQKKLKKERKESSELVKLYERTGNKEKMAQVYKPCENLEKEIKHLTEKESTFHEYLSNYLQEDLPSIKGINITTKYPHILHLYKQKIMSKYKTLPEEEFKAYESAFDAIANLIGREHEKRNNLDTVREDAMVISGGTGAFGALTGSIILGNAGVSLGLLFGGILPATALVVGYATYKIGNIWKKKTEKSIKADFEKEWTLYREEFLNTIVGDSYE